MSKHSSRCGKSSRPKASWSSTKRENMFFFSAAMDLTEKMAFCLAISIQRARWVLTLDATLTLRPKRDDNASEITLPSGRFSLVRICLGISRSLLPK